MATLKARPRKTAEDFMALPPGTLAELIEGELLIVSPSPVERHQSAVGQLFMAMGYYLKGRPLGRLFLAPFDVHLPSGDIVEPDLVFVASANLGIIQRWIYGAPDLLIEVVSPDGAARDRLVKRTLYARNGVREYWLVDPEERSVEVLGLSGSLYVPLSFLREPAVLTSPLLPGFELPLSEIFA